jgi:hypothetical protein
MQQVKVKTCFAITEKVILNTKVSCFLITEINAHLNSLPCTLTISKTKCLIHKAQAIFKITVMIIAYYYTQKTAIHDKQNPYTNTTTQDNDLIMKMAQDLKA